MADADPPGIIVREYRRADRPQIEAFRCAPYSAKWSETAEKVIREAPSAIAGGGYYAGIAVAVEEGDPTVLGVVVFGFEVDRPIQELVIFRWA